MSLLTARCLNCNSGTLGFNLRSTFRCYALWGNRQRLNLLRLRVWLHFRLRLQPLCCWLPFSATFLAILFAYGTFCRWRTLVDRNRTIHFNCAKLGRCSGRKGKFALRVPPFFASLHNGYHPCSCLHCFVHLIARKINGANAPMFNHQKIKNHGKESF